MDRFGYPAPAAICLSATSEIHRNFITSVHNAHQWLFNSRTIEIKVKVTLEQATKAQRWSRCIVLLLFNFGAGWFG
jgi:hypothetical protein